MKQITPYFAKSFYLLGDSLDYCFNCPYCREGWVQDEEFAIHTLPSEINPNFINLPVGVNMFYGDPMIQVENTVALLRRLEQAHHKGPVLITTKGDYSKFPDEPFDLDLYISFSAFGKTCRYDGGSMERLKSNLSQLKKRKNNYKHFIEYRPICYGINDDDQSINSVLDLAEEYGLVVGYCGLQGRPENIAWWESKGYDFKPFPGFELDFKKNLSDEFVKQIEQAAKERGVILKRKTSCIISTISKKRDYNAHYFRPNEVGCYDCPNREICFNFKNSLSTNQDLTNIIPFNHTIVKKDHHECIMLKNGSCKFPTPDCGNISGTFVNIDKRITTSDVRVIKWLTGMTVVADFYHSNRISDEWFKNKELLANFDKKSSI